MSTKPPSPMMAFLRYLTGRALYDQMKETAASYARERDQLSAKIGQIRKDAELATRSAYCRGWRDYQRGCSLSVDDETAIWEHMKQTFPSLID